MTADSDQHTGTWRSAAALRFSKYEVSADGFGPDQQPVRRIDNGKPLKVSVGSSGYPQVKPYNDDGEQRTVTVHSFVLGVYAGPRPDGMECRHYDDDPWNNRWRPGDEAESVAAGGNLFYGGKPQNIEDGFRNGRPRAAPRQVRHCVLCGAVLATNGRRCTACVTAIGIKAAALLGAGNEPEQVAALLEYPSTDGVVRLAVKYGNYGRAPSIVVREELNTALADHRQPRRSWLQRVTATVRDIFHRTDGSHGK